MLHRNGYGCIPDLIYINENYRIESSTQQAAILELFGGAAVALLNHSHVHAPAMSKSFQLVKSNDEAMVSAFLSRAVPFRVY